MELGLEENMFIRTIFTWFSHCHSAIFGNSACMCLMLVMMTNSKGCEMERKTMFDNMTKELMDCSLYI